MISKVIEKSEQTTPYIEGWELAESLEPALVESEVRHLYGFPPNLSLIEDFQVPVGLKECLNNANGYIESKERIAFNSGFILYFQQDEGGLTVESLAKLISWIEE